MSATGTPSFHEPSLATKMGRGVEDLVSGATEKASHIKERYLDDVWTAARGYVSENPGKTILVAAAVGFVLGSFMRRR